jgi:hypothetical protein
MQSLAGGEGAAARSVRLLRAAATHLLRAAASKLFSAILVAMMQPLQEE